MCYQRTNTLINPIDVPCTTASKIACGPNPLRCGLTLCSHKTAIVTYSFKSTAVFGVGITLSAGQQPLHLSRMDYGSAICQQMTAISSANDATPSAINELMYSDASDYYDITT
jgi:hypothetical protein